MFFNVAYSDPVYRSPETLNTGERAEYIKKEHYKILGTSIENTNISILIKNIGNAKKFKGHHTENYICYKNNKNTIKLSVSSLGYGYKVSTLNESSKKCGFINKSFENNAGLKIGLSKQKILSLLGKPSKTIGNTDTYIYWVQEKPKQEIERKLRKTHAMPPEMELWLDKYSSITVKYKNNLIVEFSVNTTETY